MRILVTRPAEDQAQTLQELQKIGAEGISAPVVQIVSMHFDIADLPWQAVIFTSRNGLRALSDIQRTRLFHVPVFCVGGKTACLAREMGFGEIAASAPRVSDLASLVCDNLQAEAGPILYISARCRSGGLEEELKMRGYLVTLIEAYESQPVLTLSADVVEAIRHDKIDGLLLYSARSARFLLELLQSHGLEMALEKTTLYCLSQVVADIFDGRGYSLVVASAPDERSLLACVEKNHNYLR